MKTRRWRVAARTMAAVAATVALGSCVEKGALPTQAKSSLVGVVLVTNIASQTAGAYQIDVKVGYNRTSGEAVTLAEQKLPVASGEQQISVTVDIAPCLADPSRGGAPDSCPLMVGITLLDANANVLDTQSQGPLAASPGKAPVAVSATLNSHFTLNVVTAGAGSGSVQLNPVGNGTATSASYAPHTSVTLTAVPGANSSFGGWSGDCSGGSATCVLTMDANRNVTATFNPRYTLTVTTTGAGTGTVTANPAGPTYAPGTSVTLTASPAAGSVFSVWSGDCTGSGTCTLVMNANKVVGALFALAPTLATITVTPNPLTINAGSTQQFAAVGRNASGNVVAITPAWSVVSGGGSISSAGLFTAGTTPGTFTNTITATSGSISGTATVIVTAGPLQKYDGNYSGSYSGTATIGGSTFPESGPVQLSVNNGVITGVFNATSVAGTINANGSGSFQASSSIETCTFSGTFTVNVTTRSASGTYACSFSGSADRESGTWTVTGF